MQILLQLKGAGLVASTRGAAGGYQLARAPDEITLADILNVIDPPEQRRRQPADKLHAGDGRRPATSCAASGTRSSSAQQAVLKDTTLADLLAQQRGNTVRDLIMSHESGVVDMPGSDFDCHSDCTGGMMADLIPPHGGVAEPINRTVADARPRPLRRRDPGLRRRPVHPLPHRRRRPRPAHRADGKEEYDRVLDEEVIVRNGKKYAWTIPLAFPVDEAKAKALNAGDDATR